MIASHMLWWVEGMELGYLWKNEALLHDFCWTVLLDLKDCEAGCWITLPEEGSDSLLHTRGD